MVPPRTHGKECNIQPAWLTVPLCVSLGPLRSIPGRPEGSGEGIHVARRRPCRHRHRCDEYPPPTPPQAAPAHPTARSRRATTTTTRRLRRRPGRRPACLLHRSRLDSGGGGGPNRRCGGLGHRQQKSKAMLPRGRPAGASTRPSHDLLQSAPSAERISHHSSSSPRPSRRRRQSGAALSTAPIAVPVPTGRTPPQPPHLPARAGTHHQPALPWPPRGQPRTAVPPKPSKGGREGGRRREVKPVEQTWWTASRHHPPSPFHAARLGRGESQVA